MCLDTVSNKPYRKGKTVYAWKVFEKRGKKSFSSPIYNAKRLFKLDKTYQDNLCNGTYIEYRGPRRYGNYRAGFHAFLYKKDAISYCFNQFGYNADIIRVKLTDIGAWGRQGVAKCVVARTMYLIPNKGA